MFSAHFEQFSGNENRVIHQVRIFVQAQRLLFICHGENGAEHGETAGGEGGKILNAGGESQVVNECALRRSINSFAAKSVASLLNSNLGFARGLDGVECTIASG